MRVAAWLDDSNQCVIVLDSDIRGAVQFSLSLNRAWRLRDVLTEVLQTAGMDQKPGVVDDE